MQHKELREMQKKIGLTFFILCLVIGLINFGMNIWVEGLSIRMGILHYNVILLLGISLVFLVTIFIRRKCTRFVQVFSVFFSGQISLLLRPNPSNSIGHGIGLIFLAILLATKYGYLRKHTLVKMGICFIITFSMVIWSVELVPEYGTMLSGLQAVAYLGLLVTLFYIIYHDEIKSHFEYKMMASSTIRELRKRKKALERKLEKDELELRKLSKKIDYWETLYKPIDLDGNNITKAEKAVIEVLCKYRCGNKELAERLGLSQSTVKHHLRHIMDKLGVDDRFAIIEMCRHYFD